MPHVIPDHLPSTHIVAPDGASAIVMHDGGHVVSWIPAGETVNRLYLSDNSSYGPGHAIRGGIPVIFPQFGPFGSLKQHGFARNCRFSPRVSPVELPGIARLVLSDSAHTRALWPHTFELGVTVLIAKNVLSVVLSVANTGDAMFTFTAALHTYFGMRSAFQAHVDGLSGLRYRDALRNGDVFVESEPSLAINGPLDRIYYDAPHALHIRDTDHAFAISAHNFPDVVVWNPGSEGTASKADFVPGDEHHMLCVEAGQIQHPHTLQPGEAWEAMQFIRAE